MVLPSGRLSCLASAGLMDGLPLLRTRPASAHSIVSSGTPLVLTFGIPPSLGMEADGYVPERGLTQLQKGVHHVIVVGILDSKLRRARIRRLHFPNQLRTIAKDLHPYLTDNAACPQLIPLRSSPSDISPTAHRHNAGVAGMIETLGAG